LAGLSSSARRTGKTSLINSLCGLQLPVAVDGQFVSTTTTVQAHPCFNNHKTEVVDTIGIFDYTDANQRQRFSINEILEMLLVNAKDKGLSSIAWVWPSRETVGNTELEEVFTTLRDLLPEVPMAIAHNKVSSPSLFPYIPLSPPSSTTPKFVFQFPGSLSGVPQHIANKWGLALLEVSRDDVAPLRQWIQGHSSNMRIVLPDNWQGVCSFLSSSVPSPYHS
jgi:hypothetical protein